MALEGVELKIKMEPLDKAEPGVIEEADALFEPELNWDLESIEEANAD